MPGAEPAGKRLAVLARQLALEPRSSNPSTTSSTTVATLGTSSSISPGGSCPLDCANGPMRYDQRVLVLYIRPLRQVFCSLSWLPSASSVPWFSSASAAWPSAPSSGACRSFPCGRRSVLNAGSDLQPICLALNHPARLLTIRSFSQRTVYFLLPPIGLSRPMPTGLQNGSPASKAAKAARRVCGPRRCVPAWLRSA